ncbi:amidohydrolase [Bradyrhizobium japonicum]|uniref:amidohydrolase n=1 Tax=Bradyrhizobium japonicum TaxID=375 RepID=UPI0004AE050F|nr:amidohydrolase [Bradyrhizobium japonicum]
MSSNKHLKKRACEAIDLLSSRLIEVSHELHRNPETAFQEFKSSEFLCSVSEKAGLRMQRGAYGLETAFSSDFELARPGPRVAVISEYDALPDVGHACGHNVIAATGLGAALALHSVKDELAGRVRYLGTPAEERGCGKELMARNGAFDDVDVAMMIHPFHVNAKALRTMFIGEAVVTYTGRPGHALLGPQTTRNALDAVVIAYQAVGALRQHLKPGENINAVITSGGSVPNVFPLRTTAHCFVRAATAEDLSVLKSRVANCFAAGAAATGCEVEVRWSDADYQPMKINAPLADVYERNAEAFDHTFTDYMSLPIAGSDMGNVSQRVPSLHALICCAPAEAILHTPQFAACAASSDGDRAVLEGAKLLAMTAIDFLTDEGLRSAIAQSHKVA